MHGRSPSALLAIGLFLAASAPRILAGPDEPSADAATGQATVAEAAPAEESADAKAQLAEAMHLWRIKKDYNGALRAFNEAVRLAPDDTVIRLQRAGFFDAVSRIVVKEDREKFRQFARDDLHYVNKQAPNSVAAGVARDLLNLINGRRLLPPRTVSCPEDAVKSMNDAEDYFAAREYEKALDRFGVAAAACPDNAEIWVSYADTYYMMHEYDRAKELFARANEADPWNRKAHRFLMDTLLHLGDQQGAFREAALSVISDPTYEAGWGSLRNAANSLGRGWNRVYADKTQVTRDTGKDGRPNVTIAITSPQKPKTNSAPDKTEPDTVRERAADGTEEEDPGDPETALWIAYGMAKAAIYGGTLIRTGEDGETVEQKVDPDEMSALEIERASVLGGLDVLAELAGDAAEERAPFWEMMQRARDAGYLDEAIFLHMMDEDLAKEYPAFRKVHADSLLRYLETVVVSKPPAQKEDGRPAAPPEEPRPQDGDAAKSPSNL